jgi:hypothetical protein
MLPSGRSNIPQGFPCMDRLPCKTNGEALCFDPQPRDHMHISVTPSTSQNILCCPNSQMHQPTCNSLENATYANFHDISHEHAFNQARRALVNDLDLRVISKGSPVYGNHLYTSKGTPTQDHVNPNEQVLIETTQAGSYTVSVTGFSVIGTQEYALVVTSNSIALEECKPNPMAAQALATTDPRDAKLYEQIALGNE